MTQTIKVIRIDDQKRTAVEYQFDTFVAAYNINDKKEATALARRLLARQQV